MESTSCVKQICLMSDLSDDFIQLNELKLPENIDYDEHVVIFIEMDDIIEYAYCHFNNFIEKFDIFIFNSDIYVAEKRINSPNNLEHKIHVPMKNGLWYKLYKIKNKKNKLENKK